MVHCRTAQKLFTSWGFIPLRHLLILRILWFQDRLYIFRKEIDAPTWQWESNCIEQPSVWADLNEFRFILDIHNEVRVISGEEKRAGSYLFLFSSLPAHCRLRKRGPVLPLSEASMSLPCLSTVWTPCPLEPCRESCSWLHLCFSLKTKTTSVPALLTSASLVSQPYKYQSGKDRGWNVWMASPPHWPLVGANSER